MPAIASNIPRYYQMLYDCYVIHRGNWDFMRFVYENRYKHKIPKALVQLFTDNL